MDIAEQNKILHDNHCFQLEPQNQFCIMRSMSSLGVSLRKTVALMLPVSIFWLSIACISICTKESIEHRTMGHQFSELNQNSDCNGCPLGSVPKATVPIRSEFQVDLQLHLSAPSSIIITYSPAEHYKSANNHDAFPVSPPPLTRLPMLRI